MGRQKVDLTKMFTKATQMSSVEVEIAQMQAEIEQLRASQAPELEAQIEVLRQQLNLQTGLQEISLLAIQPNPEQPRKTFSEQSIVSMAKTLAKDGQIHSIIVMPASNGEGFDLFDGERRWQAAQLLGWQTLKAVVMPRPLDLHRKALLTTLHREDLNPLDKAEALLREISEQTGIDGAEAQRILSTVVRRLDYKKRTKQLSELVTASDDEQKQGLEVMELSDSEQAVLQIILGLSLNPASVCTNDFRMLSLYPDLQQAIRGVSLKAAHAMVLQRLSAKNLEIDEAQAANLRVEATQEVVEKGLTLTETQNLVSQIIKKYCFKQVASYNDKQAKTIARSIKKLTLDGVKRSNLEELHQSLEQKLQEVKIVLQYNE